jgi:hypothetical protein
MSNKVYCYFNKEPYCFNGKSLAGHFNIDDYSLAILYWAEVPDPEDKHFYLTEDTNELSVKFGELAEAYYKTKDGDEK